MKGFWGKGKEVYEMNFLEDHLGKDSGKLKK